MDARTETQRVARARGALGATASLAPLKVEAVRLCISDKVKAERSEEDMGGERCFFF